MQSSTFQAFILDRKAGSSQYTCITDRYGKLLLSCPSLAIHMPHITRGIFIHCEDPWRFKTTGRVVIYNTFVSTSVSEWTYQYIHAIHFIYLICSECLQVGIETHEIWNSITTLSWQLNPQPAQIYYFILKIFAHLGIFHNFQHATHADETDEWHTIERTLPKHDELVSTLSFCTQNAQLSQASNIRAQQLINHMLAQELIC